MAIHLEYAVVAKCRPEHAWEKFKAIEQWPWWNSVISQAKWLDGAPWQKGSRFYMELARPIRFNVRCMIIECSVPNKVAWIGSKIGFRGEHRFSFAPQPDGTTLLKTAEDITGVVTFFLGEARKGALGTVHQTWIEALKLEAERIGREQLARS